MRNGLILLSATLALASLAVTSTAYYPKRVVVEMGTATW